jgi:hypothetical protein
MKKFNIKYLYSALLLSFIFIGCDFGLMGGSTYSPHRPNITYPLSTDITILTPTLMWNPGGSKSKLQLSRNINFTDNIIDEEVSSSSYSVSSGLLQYDTYYYLHVKVKEYGHDFFTDWSETVRFKTKTEN